MAPDDPENKITRELLQIQFEWMELHQKLGDAFTAYKNFVMKKLEDLKKEENK